MDKETKELYRQTNYSMENKLPRCNALDSDGKRCRRHSAIEHDYHGDGEIYRFRQGGGKEVTWVRVNLCIEHAIGVGHDFLK